MAGADPEGLYRISDFPLPKRFGEAGTDSKCTKVLIYRRLNITNLDGRLLRRRGFVGNGKRRNYSSGTLKAAATDFLFFRQVSIRRIKSTMR